MGQVRDGLVVVMKSVICCFALSSAQDIFLPASKLKAVEGKMSPPSGWVHLGDELPTKQMELTFAITQQNVGKLQDELLAISTPSSQRYGQHLSNKQVHDLVAAKPSDIQTVLDFLEVHGATGIAATPNGDIITTTVLIDVAEKLLSTDYHMFGHAESNHTVHRALGGYKLPVTVADAVDFVSPTTHMPGAHRPLKINPEASYKNVPKTLRELYSIEDPETGAEVIGVADSNRMAVTAFLNQYYSLSDLQSFWSSYCSGITCGDGLPKLVGDATTGSAGVESMLDIETITGIVGGVDAQFWGFSGTSPDNPENEPFMKWLTLVASTPDDEVPLVFSTSYGEDEASWSSMAAQRLNTEFMKTGARGIFSAVCKW